MQKTNSQTAQPLADSLRINNKNTMKKLLLIPTVVLLLTVAPKQTIAQTWIPVGTGIDSMCTNGSACGVIALAVYNAELYVAGYFTNVAGVQTNHIAKWNGTAWSDVGGGVDNTCNALCVYNGELYAGGQFTTAGGVPANQIAKWNGTVWSAVGTTGMNNKVDAFAVYNAELYAGGYFSTADGIPCSNIAKWNGTAWSAVGQGMDAALLSLCVFNGELYAGGHFTNAGGSPAQHIAKWNGTSWSEPGGGTSERVRGMAVYNSELYCGGWFTMAGTTPANYIAKWNGTAFSAVGAGLDGPVYNSMVVHLGELYVGGSMTLQGNFITKWNGTAWSRLGYGMDHRVYGVAVYNNNLYAGGSFQSASKNPAYDIAMLNPVAVTEVDTILDSLVCLAPGDQREVRMVSDSKGGAIITWVDYRGDVQNSAKGDIYLQRINGALNSLWIQNGIGICLEQEDQGSVSIAEGGASSAILTWNDFRNGDRDIYAQKVDSSGNILWATDGIAVCQKAGEQQDAKLISDGAGGAIIVWQDSVLNDFNIYAQRISNTGTELWTSGGVAVCSATFHQLNPRLEPDGSGGAIITWQDKRGGVDYDIYAQRVNSSGTMQWTANGIVIASNVGTQSNPKIEPDGSGGAIIAWQDKRSGNYDIYAQRVNGSGVVQWTANGVTVCSATGSQSGVDMTSNASLIGAVITWKDERSGISDIYAQKINLSGAPQWTANGIAIATNPAVEQKPNIDSDGNGNSFIVWQDSSADNWDIFTSKIDMNGTILWKKPVAVTFDSQTNPKNVADGTGGCIYAWQDKRNIADMNIYAIHLYPNGSPLTVEDIFANSVSMLCYPNPFSTQTTLQTVERLQNASLTVYNSVGQVVKRMDNLSGQTIIFHRDNLPSGLYFVRLTQDSKVIAVDKLVIADK